MIKAEQTLGEIDAKITYSESDSQVSLVRNPESSHGLMSSDTVKQLEQSFKSNTNIDGFLPALVFDSSFIKGTGDASQSLSVTKAELIALPNRTFASEKIDFKIDEGKAIVSKQIAERLELKVGDTIRSVNEIKPVTLIVQAINDQKGASSFTQGNGSVLVSPSYMYTELGIDKDTYNTIFVSKTGPAFQSGYNGGEFLGKVYESLPRTDTLAASSGSFQPQELKSDSIGGGMGSTISSVFLGISVVGILAGIMLLINIYSMLAEDRKSEMGTLRAIALTRNKLIKTFMYEGLLYAILSSLLGVIVGVGVGFLLIKAIVSIFKDAVQESGLDIVFWVNQSVVLSSFCAGLLITFITSYIASRRISKLSIVSAIRNLPDEKDIRFTVGKVILTLVQLMLLSNGIGSLFFGIYLADLSKAEYNKKFEIIAEQIPGPALAGYLIFIGLGLICLLLSILITKILFYLGKEKYKRYVATLFNLPLLLVALFVNKIPLFSKAYSSQVGIALLFFTGLAILITLTIICTYNLGLILKAYEAVFGKLTRFAGVVRVALRYSAENYFRTGITILMFAMILFLVSFLSVTKNTYDAQIEKYIPKTGYDIFLYLQKTTDVNSLEKSLRDTNLIETLTINRSVSATLPLIKQSELGFHKEVNGQSPMGVDMPQATDEPIQTTLYGLNEQFIKNNPLKLSKYAPEFKSADEALQAMFTDDRYLFLTAQLVNGFSGKVPDSLAPGKEVEVMVGNTQKKFKVGGLLDLTATQNYTVIQYGLVGNSKLFTDQYTETEIAPLSTSDMAIKFVKNGKTVADNTRTIQTILINYNLADRLFSISLLLTLVGGYIKGALLILQGFLSFSLLIGIAGIAIIMTRSVTQRRQQIGMLRSLGFTRGNILASFFIESSFVIFLGIAIGLLSGALSANSFFTASNAVNQALTTESNSTAVATTIIIPYTELLLVGFSTYLLSILFTIIPSYQASKLEPVEATNYLD